MTITFLQTLMNVLWVLTTVAPMPSAPTPMGLSPAHVMVVTSEMAWCVMVKQFLPRSSVNVDNCFYSLCTVKGLKPLYFYQSHVIKNDHFYFTTDVHECSLGSHNCSTNAHCINTNGSFICRCNLGYTGNGVVCYGTYQLILFLYDIFKKRRPPSPSIKCCEFCECLERQVFDFCLIFIPTVLCLSDSNPVLCSFLKWLISVTLLL